MKDIMVIRESIGRIVSMLTLQAVKVTMRGSRAYVSYHPVTGAITGMNIPFIPDDASDEFIAAIQGFLDHEVGHVLFSCPKTLIEANKDGKRIANLANIIEDVYIERKMTEAFRGSGLNLESTRKFYLERIARPKIEAALATGNTEAARGYSTVAAFRGWGGQASALDFIKEPKIAALVESVAEKLGPELIAELSKCNSSQDCLVLARKYKAKLETPKPPPPPPPDDGKMLDAMDSKGDPADAISDDKPEAEDKGTTKAEADDSGKTGAEESEKVEGEVDGGEAGDSSGTDSTDKGDADPDDMDEESPDDGDLDGEPEEHDTEEKTDLEEPSGKRAGEGDPEDDGEDDAAGTGTDGPDGDSKTDSASDEEGEGATTKGEGDKPAATGESGEEEGETELPPDPLADMFDTDRDFDKDLGEELSKDAKKEIDGSDYAVFSTEWDQIIPAPLAENKNSVERMEASIRDKVGVMQKQLERGIAAQARKAWNPGQRRGRIAPGSLFKTAVGDDRVFRQRFETKARATAVSLVVDCSGSMCGERIKLAGIAAFALSTVLERLRITHEVIGFSTTYSGEMMALMRDDATAHGEGVSRMKWARIEPIYMPVFKPFSGKLDTSARSRMAHLTENPSWLSQNVDGESVNLAARRLVQQNAERHIMIVLSDGDPCCMSGRGMNAHLKTTVKQLEKRGIEMIGIGIQSKSVKTYYPKHTVLNDTEELPTRVMAELTKLLLAA